MNLKNINITDAINSAKESLDNDKTLSNGIKATINLLIVIIELLTTKLGINTNSNNSSIPPSQDPNRDKKIKRKYNFILFSDDVSYIDKYKFYVNAIEGVINYKCIDLSGTLVFGKIEKKDLPESVSMPNTNSLEELNKIRKAILSVAVERKHIEPIKNPGGQPGRTASRLKKFDEPDEIKHISVSDKLLQSGVTYTEQGYVAKQVVDVKISRNIIEYRAQILSGPGNVKLTADFPEHVTRDIQYGPGVKSRVVFFHVYQLLPYARMKEQLGMDYQIPLSVGSVANFVKTGANNLRKLEFDLKVKNQLTKESIAHADETSVNIDGEKHWLHTFSNDYYAWMEPHKKRGAEAVDCINIIPRYQGILCHDNWSTYSKYDNCQHSTCNSHHVRELEWSFENEKQNWAKKMKVFLIETNDLVNATKSNKLSKKVAAERVKLYRQIISEGETECPLIFPQGSSKKRAKQTKSRNLLTRLKEKESSVLMFMSKSNVPFTNNLAEREIRMSKVRQKISGCFKNINTSKDFFILRSYIQTCEKNGTPAMEAILKIFNKQLPQFLEKIESG